MNTNETETQEFFPTRYSTLSVPLRLEKSASHSMYVVDGKPIQIASPVTFTPFASAVPCTARCLFCSETLIHKHATALSASLRPSPSYGARLRQALSALRKVPLGFSLSGLEATASRDWLLDVLVASEQHEAAGGNFIDKVLYSNGTGLGDPSILEALGRIRLNRVEMSRHSILEAKNDAIMRFRDRVPVKSNEIFENNIKLTLQYVPVKLVCVLQRGGVESIDDAIEYLTWADHANVDTVVFRELSRLHDLYQPNVTAKYVETSRIGIEPLVDNALENDGFKLQQVTNGYYYWNITFDWRSPSGRTICVIFETSDYLLMKRLHQSDVIYKLVFHANGHLCGDWDPNTRVILRTKVEDA